MVDKRDEDAKKYENLLKNDIAGLDILNIEKDLAKINMDESNKAKNEEFIKDLKRIFTLKRPCTS